MIYFAVKTHNDPLNFNDELPAQGFIVLTLWPLPLHGNMS